MGKASVSWTGSSPGTPSLRSRFSAAAASGDPPTARPQAWAAMLHRPACRRSRFCAARCLASSRRGGWAGRTRVRTCRAGAAADWLAARNAAPATAADSTAAAVANHTARSATPISHVATQPAHPVRAIANSQDRDPVRNGARARPAAVPASVSVTSKPGAAASTTGTGPGMNRRTIAGEIQTRKEPVSSNVAANQRIRAKSRRLVIQSAAERSRSAAPRRVECGS